MIWSFGDRIAASLAGPVQPSADMVRSLHTIAMSSVPARDRAAGRANDVKTLTDPRIDTWPLATIQVPTLIIYGDQDSGVSPAQSEQAHGELPNSRLYMVRGGGHFIGVTHASEVRKRITKFLKRLFPTGMATQTPPP